MPDNQWNMVSAEPTSQPEQQPQPPANPDLSPLVKDGKIFGKYDDPVQAEQGFWQLNNYAAQQAEQNKALQAQLAAYQQPVQAPAVDPLDQLATDALIPKDMFIAAVEKLANKVVQERFAPIEQAYQAHANLAAKFSDYETNVPVLDKWLTTNPELASRVGKLQSAGFVEEGRQLAYREWQASKGASGAPTPQQLAAAAMPNTQAQSNRGAAPESPDNFNDAVRYARQYGDPKPAYSEIFKGFQWFSGPEAQS